jgi:hypothetical protein
MGVPMFHRSRAVLPRSAADLNKRLGQSFTKRKLLRAARAIGSTLVGLSLAGVARAQGTMDFSGATTLMSEFNAGSPAVQPNVVLSNTLQIVAKVNEKMSASSKIVLSVGWAFIRGRFDNRFLQTTSRLSRARSFSPLAGYTRVE